MYSNIQRNLSLVKKKITFIINLIPLTLYVGEKVSTQVVNQSKIRTDKRNPVDK